MKINKFVIAAAIMSTFGFSCHNEPNYARVGMSNPPGGSGGAPAPAAAASAAPAAAPATPPAAPKK